MELHVPDGSEIDDRHTEYGANLSPPVSFSDVPDDAVTIVLLFEHLVNDTVRVHWLMWDVPADAAIPEGVPTQPELDEPRGAVHGNNDFDVIGYTGPRRFPENVERYRFTAYALDAALSLSPGSRKEQVLEAMKGRVVGKAVRQIGFTA